MVRKTSTPYPLSPMQAGMLFQSLYQPGKGLDIEQLVCQIPDANIAALKFAWEQVWLANPILRHQFSWAGSEQPTQQAVDGLVFPWAELDWRETPGDLEAFLLQDRITGFELDQPPLMRLTLIRHSGQSFTLIWTYHHILLDGRSLPVLLGQVAKVYQARRDGTSFILPTTRPYRDYIVWLERQDWAEAKARWQRYLQGVQSGTPLGIGFPQPPIPAGEAPYGFLKMHLTPEHTSRLEHFASQYSVTLNTLLQGVWAILLSRYSGEQDILFGAIRTGRYSALNGQDTGSMVGMLINTLPMRVYVGPDAAFLDVFRSLRTQTIHLRDSLQEHLALTEIQKFTQVPPGSRLFESIVAFDVYDHEVIIQKQHPILAGWRFDLREHVGYPLVLLAYGGESLKICLEYSRELFDETSAQRILEHLSVLFDEILLHPLAPVTQPVLLTTSERELLAAWNSTQAAYPQGICIHQVFEEQAQKTPNAVAVVFEDQFLTYRELNNRANQLAYFLQKQGVGPDVLVGVCAERSLEMVIALYGVLKAGGAYVPLDPTYPADRLSFMLEDAGVKVLLTQRKLLPLLRAQAGTSKIFSLDSDWGLVSKEPTDNPIGYLRPENLAYMIYTSGSTGRPKGALNTHAGIYNRLVWMQSAYGLDASDRILQKTPFSFDVSVWEFFWPLMYGARLVVARPEGHKDPAYLASLIQQQQVTTLHFVPSMLHAFLDSRDARACRSLKRVICSGEALPVDLTRRFFTILDAELHNLYGPTEAAVDVSWWQCRPAETLPSIPIGRPVANTQLHILDARLKPVPIGVAAELHIGGVQVGKGYLNRSELTAEKFIPNPFGPGTLYKTGDLARYMPDGNIEYLGRLDHQVKIRGFRIELGEIESALLEYPAVQTAVVVARADAQGQKRLVGYLTLEPDAASRQAETIAGLRNHLKQKLPDYMAPGILMVLPQLPLSPNGKIDRKALPEPESSALARSTQYEPPQTETEQVLARLWGELLGLERVGRQDNFFELGGDSITSLQLISRAQSRGLYLTTRQVFQTPTVAGLAEVARPVSVSQVEQGLVLGPTLLTPIQRWFFERHTLRPAHFNQAVWLEAPRPLEREWLAASLEQLIQHHDALRLRFQPGPDGWLANFAEAHTARNLIHWEDLSALPLEQQQQRMQALETSLHSALNLGQGPLLQLAVFRLTPGEPERLLFVIHHLAVDYVSWQVLIADLWMVYEHLAAGSPPGLPPKSTSFHAWAEWLQNYALSEDLLAELPYWAALGQATLAPLPVDYPGQSALVGDAIQVETQLSETETQALLRDAPEAYRTQINDILLTALLRAFAAWTGQPTLRLNLEGHGREAEGLDLSRSVGWFTALFPVQLSLGGASLGDQIKSVKEQLRQVPQKGIGYGLLRYLNPDTAARLAAHPHPEVAFNYGGQLKTASVQLSGKEWAPEEPLDYLLNINAAVIQGRLTVSWLFSRSLYNDATIRRLAEGFSDALRELIQHCLSPEAGGRTPSDFPLAGLTQDELNRLVGKGRHVADLYPLSPMQSGMLFHSIYAPDSGVYYIQNSFELTGPLDPARFHRAWQTVTDRHGILRTAFLWQGLKQPLQMVLQNVSMPWDEQDWRGLPADQQPLRLQELLQQERQRGFEISSAPLAKCTLVRLADDHYHFTWHCHHLLTDGWSIPLLLREVFDLYAQPERALPPTRPYADYIAWLLRQDISLAESFWRERLADFMEPTPLGVDRPHPEAGYQTYEHFLPSDLTDQLTRFARRHHLTLNTLLQGGYALLLKRYSNQDDVLFGVTVSGRTSELEGIEARLGPFLNTLPLRVSFPEDARLIPWLDQIQKENAHQQEYASTNLVDIQGWSGVSAGTALFESILVFENYPLDDGLFSLPEGLQVSNFSTLEQTNFPLSIVVFPGKENLKINFSFDRSRFDLDDIQRMASHLQNLLAAISTHSDQSLHSLPMLTRDETTQWLTQWNDLSKAYPPEQCLHQWFEQQALQTPEAIAVTFEGHHLTYDELNQRANRLARYLRNCGVTRETIVAMYMDRSWEMMLAMLAILKAGGAYLPIDPVYPADRVAFILEDSQAPVLLTQQERLSDLTNFSGQALCLDSQWDLVAEQCPTQPENLNQPQDLAYIIYTSGSTGKPKGVLVTHHNVVRLFQATQDWYDFGPADVWTMFHSYAFDFSVWEIWGALLYGGRVVVVPYLVSRSPESFHQLLVDEKVTVLNQTPSAFYQLIKVDEAAPNSAALRLRLVIFGGEALDLQALRPWYDRHPEDQPQLVNMYGITETTVHVTYRPVSQADLDAGWGSVIGDPIPDLQVYLLDRHRQLCPVGVIGEIYVGGGGVARGYLNRPELTAERFIQNPFDPGGQNRLYKSGDLARRLPNGELVYLGRADFQVKIRGFRVELGEIESVLGQHPQVRSALVLAKEKSSGQQYLVAYIAVKDGSLEGKKNLVPDLRAHLKKSLPAYMVPGDFVLLEQFPLTPNGKIDRRALPAGQSRQDDNLFAAPQTELEKILVDLWSGVLEVSPIGIHDDFYDLGGNSLLSVRLLARIQQLGLQVSLRQFLENPTVARLAAVIQPARMNRTGQDYRSGQQTLLATSSTLLTLQPFGRRLPLFLIHPSGGSALSYANLSRLLGNDQPSFGLEAVGLYDDQSPDRTVEQMADRYLHAIQKVAPKGPYCLAGWSFGGVVAFEMAQRLLAAGEQVRFVGMFDSMLPAASLLADSVREIKRLIDWSEGFFKVKLPITPDELARLNADAQLDLLLQKMMSLGLDVSNLEFIVQSRVFVARMRSEQALAVYQPRPYPAQLTLFRAEALSSERESDRLHPDFADPAWGWNRYTRQPVQVELVPGHHDVMVDLPYVRGLAEKLKTHLDLANQ